MFVTGVKDTTQKLLLVSLTSLTKTMLPILACLRLKMKNKQKFNQYV
jgi:hypothetical protein